MAVTETKRKSRFALGMLIYALVFLLLTAVGLGVFWQFMESYELSRPLTAVNAYLDGLTMEQIRTCVEPQLASLDGNIQNPDQAFAVIEEVIGEDITAAKSSKKSSAEKMVYMLRSGPRTIGSVAIIPGGEERFGFTPWQLAEESFDFSWLLSEPISITVPAEFTVSLNGNPLDERYVTETGIPYPVLADFHGEFEMPTMVTYRAENFLGDLAFAVTDASGSPVEITAETDMDSFIPRGSPEETADAEELLRKFLVRYTVYSSSANRDAPGNYAWLNQLLVPRGELSKRLMTALDGLQYVQSMGDEIVSTDIHGIYKLSEERYMCDVSYVLRTKGRKGAVEMEQNMKVILLQTNNGLRVEAMTRY